jgi:hypothetical protein
MSTAASKASPAKKTPNKSSKDSTDDDGKPPAKVDIVGHEAPTTIPNRTVLVDGLAR